MSRVGKKPIRIPEGVTVTKNGDVITVKGPLGTLEHRVHRDMVVEIDSDTIVVKRPSDQPVHRALHGVTRTMIANMVDGVTKGFEKHLTIVGTGYRAAVQGRRLTLNVGYSHPVEIVPPEGVTIETPTPTTVVVKGTDKQVVGQVAANIRKVRPPEPYHGKGIRYRDERVRHIPIGKTVK
ncbi:MAG TPA: 50S ribosomal protein L6 [Clostridiales bacterium]|nr:50S ribosomal protein L6 [Clostridiales bacterium]